MQHLSIKRIEAFQRFRRTTTIAFGTIVLAVSLGSLSYAQKPIQETFSSAEEASHALFVAVQTDNPEALMQVLGGGKDLVSSNDEMEDKLEREKFAQKYQEMHRLVRESDGTTVLYVGAENWPFPVPLVLKSGAWYFDSDSGAKEILFRQVGENEATAIETCHELVRATKPRATAATSTEMASNEMTTAETMNAATGNEHVSQYAQTFVTTHATNVGNETPAEKASGAFHGYYFRILSGPLKSRAGAKGNDSRAGAGSGDIFIAYPVEYRSSGVMTFIVTGDDVVYEKDLGRNTVTLAVKMTARSLNSSWHRVE